MYLSILLKLISLDIRIRKKVIKNNSLQNILLIFTLHLGCIGGKMHPYVELIPNNSTMDKTEAQIVFYGILYLNPSSYQCQPSYKKYIAV